MSNATYEIMWRDAMGDLNEQLNVEGVEEDDDLANQLGDGQKSVRSNLLILGTTTIEMLSTLVL